MAGRAQPLAPQSGRVRPPPPVKATISNARGRAIRGEATGRRRCPRAGGGDFVIMVGLSAAVVVWAL
jgi:hypothetical protein